MDLVLEGLLDVHHVHDFGGRHHVIVKVADHDGIELIGLAVLEEASSNDGVLFSESLALVCGLHF